MEQEKTRLSTAQVLTLKIKEFLAANPRISKSAFGLATVGTSKLLLRLERGGDVTTHNLDKILAFMHNYNKPTEQSND